MNQTNYKEIQVEAKQFVVDYFEHNNNDQLVYHNAQHTQEVVEAVGQIANHYQLEDKDYFIVYIAALFHDTGYFTDFKNHKEKGAELALTFLEGKGVSKEVSKAIAEAILSTKIPQKPNNILENIICDADLFHLGSENYKDKSKLMHREFELLHNKNFTKTEWHLKDIQFLEQHHYHTDYCQLLLNDQKQKNLDRLKKKAHLNEKENKDLEKKEAVNALFIEPEKSKKEKPERGIETMFRITSANNQRLSDMADNKAHILITVNSIILSLVVSLLLRKLDNNSFLVIPTFTLLLVSLACVVVSILSTRPSIPGGVFSNEDLEKKRVNLLFFGNFYKMSLDNYIDGMAKVMSDKEFLYGTLIRDVYSQGVVLGRKYKLIRLAYNIFMFGLIISVMAFVVAYTFFVKN